MKLDLKLDISRAKSSAVTPEHGVTPAELRDLAPRISAAHDVLMKQRKAGGYGFWDLYKDAAMRKDCAETAEKFRADGIENLVVLGIGGSALGITALSTALLPPYFNLGTKRSRKGAPRLFVMDNIDPITFKQMMRVCPPKKTLYNVISKSGGTAETLSQAMLVIEQIEKKVGVEAISDHVVITTGPKGESKSLLHPVADAYGIKTFDIPLNVGGRFSVFTPVGLFPAAMLGMDIEAMAEGCAAMDARCATADLDTNPAYLHGAVQYIADTQKGKTLSVMMPYADGLRDVADWYRQLWAESLGKQFDNEGNEVFAGQTPVNALGVTDQHSQIQLYREGPNDKIITTLEVASFGKTCRIPSNLPMVDGIDYLRGASLNKLLNAELRGTIDALKKSLRPVCRIVFPRVNAHTVAQLFYMLEVETALGGQLYNVDAFNQPGVEEGKVLARQLMGSGA